MTKGRAERSKEKLDRAKERRGHNITKSILTSTPTGTSCLPSLMLLSIMTPVMCGAMSRVSRVGRVSWCE